MGSCPIARIGRLIMRARDVLDQHASECGDRVLAFALNPVDFAAMSVCELWGLAVLEWEEVEKGTLTLLCEADGVLIPQVDTVQELIDRWTYDLKRPDNEADAA
jgi:hypothetical protein